MIKKWLVVLLIVLQGLSAFSLTLRALQSSYYEEVLLYHVYKERFSKFFNYKCQPHDEVCHAQLFRKLKNDITPQKDEKLQALYTTRMEKTAISSTKWEAITRYFEPYVHLLTRTQFVTMVDLSSQQMLVLLWYAPHGSFYLIGADLISSGNIEREAHVKRGEDHYFKTPMGIFEIRSGWRSEGKTLEDKVTYPYGMKTRYIFYFGKQKSTRYHTFTAKGEKMTNPKEWRLIEDTLSFALHAHESHNGLGDPYSHGCIRMTNELNLFMDTHSVLHAHVYDGSRWISRSANPPKKARFQEWAGRFLFVVDAL